MEIEVCDSCEEQEQLFKCKLCKGSNEVFCDGCMEEHLTEEHGEEIIDEIIDEVKDSYMEKK